MSHPFGVLLRQYRGRKNGLTQMRLAERIGYDQAILTRMTQGKRELTGPSGRARVVLIIAALRDEGVLNTLEEANALLAAAHMPPLYQAAPDEAALIKVLRPTTSAEAASSGGSPTRNNLPVSLTGFVGRKREIAEVMRLLGTTRLLTLTGSGGCGKTRLAIEVGARCAPAVASYSLARGPDGAKGATGATTRVAPTLPDGVWMVEFAALSEGRLVSDTVTSVFGLQAMSRTSEEVLIEHLSDKQLLLILDNCEHLIHESAALAVKLLQTCPRLRLLVTSREGLNVPGEVTWRVPSLAHDEAMALFVERARAVRPDFAFDETNTRFAEHICERLDAMPLALELAAARLRSFSVEQIAARLDDVFRVLAGGSRTALPRQQTLKATIDWSYALLPEEERTLLCELAVFAGGWTLEAAEAVHGQDTLDLLDQLVSKSLVQTVQTPLGPRYTMLEMIRQYASVKLLQAGRDAVAQVRTKHMTFYHELEQDVRQFAAGGLGGPEEKTWRDRGIQDVANFRVAVEWTVESNNWQVGVNLIECLIGIWNEPGYLNVLEGFIDKVIFSNPTVSDRARCTGFLLMADGLQEKGDMVGSTDWCKRAVDLAHQIEDNDLVNQAELLLLFSSPDYAETMISLERMRDNAHWTGNISNEVGVYYIMGYRMTLEGHYLQAIETLKKAETLIQGNLQYPRIATCWRLGQAYLAQGDYAHALSALELGQALARESGRRISVILVDLGTVGVYTGDHDIARRALVECFDWEYRHDNMERLAQGLVLGAGLAHALGKLDTAAQLLGATAAIRKVHHTHGVCERELFLEYDRRLPAVRAAMDPDAFQRAWDAGQALTIKEAMAAALAL